MKDRLKLLQAFLASDKPEWAETIDVLLMAHLIARADDRMCSNPSWETLARCSKVHYTTIYRAIPRLESSGWIVKHSGKRRQVGNTYVVQVGNLPLKDFTPTTITTEAKKLAFWYYAQVQNVKIMSKRWKKPIRPYVLKGWQERWAYVIQQWLNQGHGAEQIQAAVSLAFEHNQRLAAKGPHTLRRDWNKIITAVQRREAK